MAKKLNQKAKDAVAAIVSDKYQSPDISGHEDEIRGLVLEYVNLRAKGLSDEEKRRLFPVIRDDALTAVSVVMEVVSPGYRVDGKTVRPILEAVVDELIAALPEPEVEEEV